MKTHPLVHLTQLQHTVLDIFNLKVTENVLLEVIAFSILYHESQSYYKHMISISYNHNTRRFSISLCKSTYKYRYKLFLLLWAWSDSTKQSNWQKTCGFIVGFQQQWRCSEKNIDGTSRNRTGDVCMRGGRCNHWVYPLPPKQARKVVHNSIIALVCGQRGSLTLQQ